MADQLGMFTALGLMSILSITQLLSMLGIAVEINLIMWLLVMPVVGGLVGLVNMIFMGLGYDNAYSISQKPTDTNYLSAVMSVGVYK